MPLSQDRVPPISGFSPPTYNSLETRIMRKGGMHMRFLYTNPPIVQLIVIPRLPLSRV